MVLEVHDYEKKMRWIGHISRKNGPLKSVIVIRRMLYLISSTIYPCTCMWKVANFCIPHSLLKVTKGEFCCSIWCKKHY